MPVYRYEALDKTGKALRGAMDVPSEQDLQQRLFQMGYQLKAATLADQFSTKTAANVAARAVPRPSAAASFPVSLQPIVPLSALMRFYRQLATLVRSGMSVGQAMDELTGTTANAKLRKACMEMKGRVQSGEALSAGLATYPLLFPVHTVGLIWAGEQGGYLDIALDEAATLLEKETKDKLWGNIGWFLANVNFFLFVLFFPIFDIGKLFQLTQTTPGGTPGVLRAMAEMYKHGFITMCIPTYIIWFVSAIVWKRLKRMPSVRRTLDGLLLMVPGWGKLHRERARERFLTTLAMQCKAGVPMAQGWAAASMTVRNSDIANRLRVVESVMRSPEGNLQAAFAQSGAFEAEDSGMIASGERAGSVPEILERMSNYHNESASRAKLISRGAAIHGIILVMIVLPGIITILMARGYRDFFNFMWKFMGME